MEEAKAQSVQGTIPNSQWQFSEKFLHPAAILLHIGIMNSLTEVGFIFLVHYGEEGSSLHSIQEQRGTMPGPARSLTG